jgi:hypothetical protein
MIARLDHHPMLTAALALTTAVLLVVVITLATLLITSSSPAAISSSQSGGNPGAAVQGNGDFYGEGWNNYGHDMDRPQPAKTGNVADPNIDRHAEVVAAHHGLQ